jgi:hypothetical protein
MSRTQKALAELNKRIEAGAEFPDAAFAVAMQYKVKQSRLENAYDAEQSAACFNRCSYMLQELDAELN